MDVLLGVAGFFSFLADLDGSPRLEKCHKVVDYVINLLKDDGDTIQQILERLTSIDRLLRVIRDASTIWSKQKSFERAKRPLADSASVIKQGIGILRQQGETEFESQAWQEWQQELEGRREDIKKNLNIMLNHLESNEGHLAPPNVLSQFYDLTGGHERLMTEAWLEGKALVEGGILALYRAGLSRQIVEGLYKKRLESANKHYLELLKRCRDEYWVNLFQDVKRFCPNKFDENVGAAEAMRDFLVDKYPSVTVAVVVFDIPKVCTITDVYRAEENSKFCAWAEAPGGNKYTVVLHTKSFMGRNLPEEEHVEEMRDLMFRAAWSHRVIILQDPLSINPVLIRMAKSLPFVAPSASTVWRRWQEDAQHQFPTAVARVVVSCTNYGTACSDLSQDKLVMLEHREVLASLALFVNPLVTAEKFGGATQTCCIS